MSKGDATRGKILDYAARTASTAGLEALTIGALAGELSMSKSGLFAHFGSKEALQRAVIEHVLAQFAADVAAPALALPPGRAQVRALAANWIAWSRAPDRPGGCPLAAAAFDLDAQPGALRDQLAAAYAEWRATLVAAVERGKQADIPGHVDANEIALEIFGLYFAQHVHQWLLDDPSAGARALKRLDALLGGAA